MSKLNNLLVGIDLETGGLDDYLQVDGVTKHGAMYHPILEIGVVIADSNLNVIDKFSVGIKATSEMIERIAPEVLEMHTNSGLIAALTGGTSELVHDYLANDNDSAQAYVIERLEKAGATKYDFKERTGSIVFGNNVGFDMNFLSAQMRDLAKHFHYRKIDVSGVEMLSRTIKSWADCGFVKPDKKYAHTALSDILESLEELKAYSGTLDSLIS